MWHRQEVVASSDITVPGPQPYAVHLQHHLRDVVIKGLFYDGSGYIVSKDASDAFYTPTKSSLPPPTQPVLN